MSSEDVIAILQRYPGANLRVSVDVSTSEENFDRRAFGQIIEYQVEPLGDVTLICVGELNFDVPATKEAP